MRLVLVEVFVDDLLNLIIAEAVLLPFAVVFLSLFFELVPVRRFVFELLVELEKLCLLRVVKEHHRRKSKILHMTNVGCLFHQFNTQRVDLHDIYHNQGIIVEFLIIHLNSMQTFELFRYHDFQISDKALLK